MGKNNIKIQQVAISVLNPAPYNPRKWEKDAEKQLTESITRFGLVDPIIVNNAPERANIVIGGHFRLKVAKQLGYQEVPVVYVTIPDVAKEKELNLRLNRNTGEWDWSLLVDFDSPLLTDVGFSSEELDRIFGFDETPEIFDLAKELEKLHIGNIEIQKGDVIQLGDNRLMCGDSTIEANTLKLMNGEKADMCFTDPPYILDYLHGKKKNTLNYGTIPDKREIINALGGMIYIHNQLVCSAPSKIIYPPRPKENSTREA